MINWGDQVKDTNHMEEKTDIMRKELDKNIKDLLRYGF